MSVEFVFAPGTGNELIIDGDEVNSYNLVKTHTGLSDGTVVFRQRRDLDNYAQRQDRVNVKIDGSVEWAGYTVATDHSGIPPTTTDRLDGIAKRLEETRPDYDNIGGSVTYSNIALEDAIDDYWGRTPFSNHSVTPQSTNTVATEATVQSADTQSEWDNISSIAADVPVGVVSGELTALQTCWVFEAENPTIDSGIRTYTDADFSGGEGMNLVNATNEKAEYEFTPQYTIPQEHVGGRFRNQVIDSSDESSGLDLFIAGQKTSQISNETTSSLAWDNLEDFDSYDSGDLQAGTTYKIKVATDSNPQNVDKVKFDAFAVFDDRYTYNFDNDNGGNSGYLDGPELYPDGVTVSTDQASASFNITAVHLDSTWDDTSGAQQIEATLDGSNYVSESNTETLDKDFTNQVGRFITIRYTFDRYGSRTTATPQKGFKGQSIDSVTVNVDGDDLAVIDSLELQRDHFSNLQTLHDYGGFLWVIEHDASDISNMTVTSFKEGDETRQSLPEFDDPSNQSSQVNGENYYNTIYIQGAEDAQGNRPTATVKDQDAINTDGREISPGVLRDPDITTESGAIFRARTLLSIATSNNDLEGSVSVPPKSGLTNPGYARKIDFGEGKNLKTVEEVALTNQPGSIQAVYQFSLPNDLAEDISNLRRETRSIGDKV